MLYYYDTHCLLLIQMCLDVVCWVRFWCSYEKSTFCSPPFIGPLPHQIRFRLSLFRALFKFFRALTGDPPFCVPGVLRYLFFYFSVYRAFIRIRMLVNIYIYLLFLYRTRIIYYTLVRIFNPVPCAYQRPSLGRPRVSTIAQDPAQRFYFGSRRVIYKCM